MAKIVIDPGHGGSQSIPNDSTWNNAVGPNGTLEKTLTLDVGRRTAQSLAGSGHEVRLTRNQDVNLRLRDRARVARDMSAHAFVSIHFNGSTHHNAQGTETLVHTNHSQTSARLSLAVQDAVLAVTGLTDRNYTYNQSTRIKPQSLGVLRPSYHDPSTAACLAEISFLDRAEEEQRLQSEAYRQDIAEAVADGIRSFLGASGLSLDPVGTELGDAIEIAALEFGGSSDPAAWLGLNVVTDLPAAAPEAGTADLGEAVATPAEPFSPAFVENSGPPMALIANDPSWPDLQDFVQLISGLGLSHFTPDEFLYMGASNASGPCGGRNTFPPRNLWNNIVKTALMLDAVRTELGAPIRILSCYRSADYNACVGGENNSLHSRFNAIDFTCSAGTPEIWRRIAAKLRSKDPRFVGGIGVYPARRFVHIDTRGSEANWQG